MFKCDRCKTQTQKGEVMTRLIVETRTKEYSNQGPADFFTGIKPLPTVSKGFEPKKELSLCPSCVKEANVDEFGRSNQVA